jgi:hypothetical protein
VLSGQLTQSWFPNLTSALAALGDFEIEDEGFSSRDKSGRVSDKLGLSRRVRCETVLEAVRASERRL